MSFDLWTDLSIILRNQLKPYGYCGHLLSFLQSKSKHLEDIIKRTALMSESNSVLIIGPIGSGKSALLESVLDTVFQDVAIKENMLHVDLNGLVHTNDNLALEDITRQLKMRQNEDQSLGNFSEKLRLLLSALKGGNKESKSVLFVLDNFDLFCLHKNQSLLYNLFDIAQSQQTPVCVIGMCSRPDLLQTLENRVNSRFSHQKTLLFEDVSLTEYLQAAEEMLRLHGFQDGRFQKRWNTHIAALFKNPEVKKVLEKHYLNSNVLRNLKEFLYLVAQNVDSSHPNLTLDDFVNVYESHCHNDSKAAIMTGLSVLEISLVVAMMHLTEIYDNEPFNFEIVYNELGRFLRNRMKWNIEKPVVIKAFEHLLELELVKSTSETINSGLKRYVLVRLLVAPNEVRETIENYQNLPVQIKYWTDSTVDG